MSATPSDTPDSDTPDIVPAYGEAGPEAQSMEQAAEGEKANKADAGVSEQPVPADALVQGHGTTETDVAARIAADAKRRDALASK